MKKSFTNNEQGPWGQSTGQTWRLGRHVCHREGSHEPAYHLAPGGAPTLFFLIQRILWRYDGHHNQQRTEKDLPRLTQPLTQRVEMQPQALGAVHTASPDLPGRQAAHCSGSQQTGAAGSGNKITCTAGKVWTQTSPNRSLSFWSFLPRNSYRKEMKPAELSAALIGSVSATMA